jgi:carbonic anhydrase/acetyltransferase-like protein (isoleucine patch superfamily)
VLGNGLMLRAHHVSRPVIAASAYIHESAQVSATLSLVKVPASGRTLPCGATVNSIRIGEDTSIQDNSVLHCEAELFPLQIGNRVTIEHRATVHGRIIEDDCVIQISAVVLNGARIGRGSLISPGAGGPDRFS